MWQIFLGSLTLSVIHALIPSHWLPLVAIGKSEKWSTPETLSATAIAGFAHILSTVVIGIIVGFIGFKLSGTFELITTIIAPVLLISIGLIYILLDYFRTRKQHHHDHIKVKTGSSKSKIAILISLSIAMFLSPCLELEAYYFHAGTFGWKGIAIVSVVFTLVTVSTMVILVWIGMKGMARIKSDFMEHHEKSIAGIVLILLGILSLFVKF